jgi:hypothetical protein
MKDEEAYIDKTKNSQTTYDIDMNHQDNSPFQGVLPAVKEAAEPDREFWSYVGTDSTAVNEITVVAVGAEADLENEELDSWLEENTQPEKDISKEQLIEQGIKLAQSISAAANREMNLAQHYFASRAIFLGLICLRLKELIKGSKKPWGSWAEENLPFIAKRNRGKYMFIASRPDSHPFKFLGVDRMEILCSVTKEMEGENRIGNLLRKYEIPFDSEMEMNINEFKALIDTAVANEKLLKSDLIVDLNMVANVVNIGIQFDKAMIRRLKEVKKCGGNPETLLQQIALTGGKDDNEPTPEKRLQDFNHLGNRLLVTLDFIEKDQDQLVKIDRETFRKLIEKLQSIQELGILDMDEQHAA